MFKRVIFRKYSYFYSNQLQVLEFDRPLPRFSTQVYYPDAQANPEGFMDIDIGMKKDLVVYLTRFKLKTVKVNRWLLQNFLITEDDVMQISSNNGKWSATFCCCYSKNFLAMSISENGQVGKFVYFYDYFIPDAYKTRRHCDGR
jgi:hypothetical protein